MKSTHILSDRFIINFLVAFIISKNTALRQPSTSLESIVVVLQEGAFMPHFRMVLLTM